jgi:hypothetical protein
MKALVTVFLAFGVCAALAASATDDPYQTISSANQALLKPQIERWVRNQTTHNWSDMWEIQDQTPELKNELLSGRRDAPDMNRNQYVEAMRDTMGSGYPEIKAFTLVEVDNEVDGFQVVGCAKKQREEWKQTSIEYVHVRIVHGRVLFGLPDGSSEECKL